MPIDKTLPQRPFKRLGVRVVAMIVFKQRFSEEG